MKTPGEWYIYVLLDPRTEEVRYVGTTKKPGVRFNAHLEEARREPKSNHRRCWISQLQNEGLKPAMVIIETGTGNRAKTEKEWIAAFRALGYRLVNSTDGGDGTAGYQFTAEVRKKMSVAQKGRKHTPETRAKISAYKRGRPGRKQSSEVREKIATTLKDRKFSPETRAKISAALKGRKFSAETLVRMSVGQRRRFGSHKGSLTVV